MDNIKKGDRGYTDSLAAKNIKKDDPRVIALARLDRLSTELGMAKLENPALKNQLTAIQAVLIEIMGTISGSGKKLGPRHLDFLDGEISRLKQQLPPLKEFVLPGVNRAEISLHLARTSCRLAETTAVAANTDADILAYINRLSLYLFTLARRAAKDNDID